MRSIQSRLILTYLVLVFFSTAVTFFFFVPQIKDYLEKRTEVRLRSENQALAILLSRNYHDSNLTAVAGDLRKNFSDLLGVRFRLYDARGNLVGDSGAALVAVETLAEESRPALQGQQVTWIELAAERTVHVSTPLRASGSVYGVVDVVSAISDSVAMDAVRNIIGYALLVSAAASWFLAVLLAQTIVRPVARLRAATGRIAQGDLTHRVPHLGSDELAQLGEAVNGMAAQLESRIFELTSEKNKMNRLLESLIDGVVTTDRENRITFVNQVAERLLHVPAYVTIGKPVRDAFANPLVPLMLTECVDTLRLVSREITVGAHILKLFVLPFQDERKLFVGTIMVIHDITDLRRLEEARSQFLGAVSHELRTPLTIIKGFVVTLLDNDIIASNAELKRSLEMVDRETDRLSRLVEEVLELSRMRSKKMAMQLTPLQAEEAVNDTLQEMHAHAGRVGVKLSWKLAEVPTRIMADADRFRQIILNLVDNAIKYTPSQGQVFVSTQCRGKEWMVEIRDTGAGIPEDEIPFLFERFFRGKDKKRKDSPYGFGLGLAIVRELVEAHAARIEVQSKINVGTQVRLYFPIVAV